MIEIFETCQTKSIAKQTNRDESLIIRSIDVGEGGVAVNCEKTQFFLKTLYYIWVWFTVQHRTHTIFILDRAPNYHIMSSSSFCHFSRTRSLRTHSVQPPRTCLFQILSSKELVHNLLSPALYKILTSAPRTCITFCQVRTELVSHFVKSI